MMIARQLGRLIFVLSFATALTACSGGNHEVSSEKSVGAELRAASISTSFGSACAAGASCNYSGATENANVSASCSTGTLTVSSSTYGMNSSTESCLSYAAVQCNGKASCNLNFNNSTCGADPDYGILKSASMSVSCSSPASPSTQAFSSVCASGASCNYAGAVENGQVNASCAAGTITANSSIYGQGSMIESCLNYAVTQCNGKSSCSLNFNNATCGADPDYGVQKSASLSITCSSPVSVSSQAFGTSCAAGSTCNYSGASENQQVSLSCASGAITSNSASYGQGSKTESCLSYLAATCNGQSSCSVNFNNSSCSGDPNVGILKAASVSISCAAASQPTSTLPAAIANMNYVQTFDDEFTSMSDISSGGTYNGAKWYNGTEQCCMSDTSGGLPAVMYPSVVNGLSVDPYSLISGGGLNITLSKQNNAWYSGVLTSVDYTGKGFSQQYGYFEITAQLSGDPGTWPAFWMLNTANLSGNAAAVGGDGEIDIFEQYNTFHNGFCTTFHDWSGGTTPYYNCGISVSDVTVGYHKYAMLWTASTMSIYFDDVQVATTSTPSVMKQPYYMLIDMGLGGGWPTNLTPNSSTMKVKSVKVWASQ